MRSVLIASKVTLSLMLVSGAGLLVKLGAAGTHVSGFRADRGLTFGVSLPSARLPKDEEIVQTLLERRLRENPKWK